MNRKKPNLIVKVPQEGFFMMVALGNNNILLQSLFLICSIL